MYLDRRGETRNSQGIIRPKNTHNNLNKLHKQYSTRSLPHAYFGSRFRPDGEFESGRVVTSCKGNGTLVEAPELAEEDPPPLTLDPTASASTVRGLDAPCAMRRCMLAAVRWISL